MGLVVLVIVLVVVLVVVVLLVVVLVAVVVVVLILVLVKVLVVVVLVVVVLVAVVVVVIVIVIVVVLVVVVLLVVVLVAVVVAVLVIVLLVGLVVVLVVLLLIVLRAISPHGTALDLSFLVPSTGRSSCTGVGSTLRLQIGTLLLMTLLPLPLLCLLEALLHWPGETTSNQCSRKASCTGFPANPLWSSTLQRTRPLLVRRTGPMRERP